MSRKVRTENLNCGSARLAVGAVIACLAAFPHSLEAGNTAVATTDSEASRAGLARFLELNEHISDGSPVAGCPFDAISLIDSVRSSDDSAGQSQGVFTELETAPRATDGVEIRSLECAAIGGTPGDLAPTGIATLTVIDLLDLDRLISFLDGVVGGEPESITVAGLKGDVTLSCVDTHPRSCIAWWSVDSLAIGISIEADTIDVERVGALAADLIPSVLSSLESWAEETASRREFTSDELDAVGAAVASGGGQAPVEPGETDCPVLSREAVIGGLDDADVEMSLDDWTAVPAEFGASIDRPSLSCAGDDDAETPVPNLVMGPNAMLSVVAFTDSEAGRQLIESGQSIVQAAPLPISGDLLLATCFDLGPALTTCQSRWWQDQILVQLTLTGDPASVRAAAADAALWGLVPALVDRADAN